MKILAKGGTPERCQAEIDRLKKSGWEQAAEIKFDNSFIGGRWVCVMSKPDNPNHKKRKFNQYMGF